MSAHRYIGLSNKQSVPPLLTTIRKLPRENMKHVADDDPPLSDSDLNSDNDGLPTRGDIQPSRFSKARQEKSPPRRVRDVGQSRRDETAAASSRGKRTRTSTRQDSREPFSSPRDLGRKAQVSTLESTSGSPAAKKLKKSLPDDEKMGSQFSDNFMDLQRKPAKKWRYGSSKFDGGRVRGDTPTAKSFIPPPKDATPEVVSPDRKKFRMPSSPSKLEEDPESPRRNFKAVPDSGFEFPAKGSPVRRKRLKMPKEESQVVPEESQRPVFTMPDDFSDSFIEDEVENFDYTLSPKISPSNPADTLRSSSSSLSELESIDITPICPLCKKEVDSDLLADFKTKHPRMTVSQMQKFCHQHKKNSAKQTWLDRGYPDIDWHRLDARIAQRYGFLRGILEGDRPSYYDDAFHETVEAGQNRTLFRSDANLTPGYYGIRGLRAMSENLIGEFSALLRQRALQDRLVSARGHTAYLQSVLVPELAVQLIVEDMGVGEEEARTVLAESSWVGELLNDEIADVVLEDDDDDDDNGNESDGSDS